MADRMEISVRMADGENVEKRFAELSPLTIVGTAHGLNEAMNQIGIASTQKFMINAGGFESARLAPIHPTKLTIRTGRLARSVVNSFTFSITRLPRTRKVTNPKPKTIAKFGNGQKEGFRKIFFDGVKLGATMGTTVEYASLHEQGIGRFPARPFLEPALEFVRPKLSTIIDKELGKVYRITGWK